MKKKMTVLICIFCLILPLLPARTVKADLIYEPDNSFYASHAYACLSHSRSYTTPGDTEYYNAPGDIFAAGSLEADASIHVYWLYRDGTGNDWGYFEYRSPGHSDRSGWIRMEGLYLNYDSQEFFLDHADEIDSEASETIPEGSDVVFWNYPGAEPYLSPRTLPADMQLSSLYTDSYGNRWGYCPYFHGTRNIWICISDPASTDLPVAENLPRKYYKAPENLTVDKLSLLLIVLPVAAVILISILLLKKFWKKRN